MARNKPKKPRLHRKPKSMRHAPSRRKTRLYDATRQPEPVKVFTPLEIEAWLHGLV